MGRGIGRYYMEKVEEKRKKGTKISFANWVSKESGI